MAKLSYEAILAALVAIGCSKTESAAPAPETTAPKAVAPGASAATPAAAAPPIASAAVAPVIDAGVEKAPPSPVKPMNKGASAACGPGACSPDMKKGNK